MYIKKLIDGAKGLVPSDAQASTPILLMATAGMRLLTSKEQGNVLQEVRRVLHDKTICPFQFKDEDAQAITGTEEAVYGWIAVNFLSDSFCGASKKVPYFTEN